MREVIRIGQAPKGKEKPVEFTHIMRDGSGWFEISSKRITSSDVTKIIHLGKCEADGDIFAVYRDNGIIDVCKGYINSGKY